MFHKLLRIESGYSLVEVMVAIIILAIGILPMVGMLDMGLHSATTGSNYDKARALANLKMEEAKSPSFDSVKNDFPVTGSTPNTTNGYNLYTCSDLTVCEPAVADSFPEDFEYTVEKQVMKLPTSSSTDFERCNSGLSNTCDATPTGPIRVTVTVRWEGGDNEYRTVGLVT